MRVVALLAAMLFGSSCASLDQQATQYSSQVLCYGVDAGNVQQQAAASRELSRRGHRCTPEDVRYGAAEWQAIQNRQSAANAAAAQYFLNRSAGPPINTQTYIINGRTVTCTTSGSVTNCN